MTPENFRHPQPLRVILEVVAGVFGVSVAQIKGECRIGAALNARHVACYLMSRLAGASLQRIGDSVGRDHTTILSALRRIDRRMERFPDVREKLEICEHQAVQRLQSWVPPKVVMVVVDRPPEPPPAPKTPPAQQMPPLDIHSAETVAMRRMVENGFRKAVLNAKVVRAGVGAAK